MPGRRLLMADGDQQYKPAAVLVYYLLPYILFSQIPNAVGPVHSLIQQVNFFLLIYPVSQAPGTFATASSPYTWPLNFKEGEGTKSPRPSRFHFSSTDAIV